jgi:winged helix DNA-binding protein
VAAGALSKRVLNRALLARQLLLERHRLAIPEALERVAGLQAQYAPATYFGLWSRLEGFERDALTRALERREVVQATLMRATIHVVSPRDYWPPAVGARSAQRERWLKSRKGDPSARQMAAAARRLRRALAGATMHRREIEELLGKRVVEGVGLWLDLVRVPPSGTWERRRADLYALAEEWLTPEPITHAAAVEHLVRRYLGGFGPAPAGDIAGWAGLPVSVVARAVGRMELDRYDGGLVDLPGAPLPHPDTPAPVRFLPVWDAMLLVHARRTGVLAEDDRPRIFNVRRPHGTATFLVDGAVAGSWTLEDGRVRLEPYTRLDRATRRALEDEAERLAAFAK